MTHDEMLVMLHENDLLYTYSIILGDRLIIENPIINKDEFIGKIRTEIRKEVKLLCDVLRVDNVE